MRYFVYLLGIVGLLSPVLVYAEEKSVTPAIFQLDLTHHWAGYFSLLLNYFGQGALLIERPEAIQYPFCLLAPTWALYPLLFLATLATVIASQSVISGAFSVTRQATQLG